MYTARNRRAATPPNITPRISAQLSRRPAFPADVLIPPHRGAVAQQVDLAGQAASEPHAAQPTVQRQARKQTGPQNVQSKKERARKARLVRNKARAARKAKESKPRKDKAAARIEAPRPTGQPLTTPPVIALPQLPEPLVETAACAALAQAAHPSAAPRSLPRAPAGSRPADPPPAGRPSTSGTALAIPRPPLVIQLAEWIDRRLREVWRAMGGQPPRKRRSRPRARVSSHPDASPQRQPPPLAAEELARLRAENAALRRQLEALVALREPLTPA